MFHSLLALVTVKTPAQLNALNMQTYIFGAVVGLIMLAIAAFVANRIKFEGGQNPKDPGKRRMWFWLLLAITFVAFFLYNKFSVAQTVSPNLQGKFMTATLVGCGIAVGIYLIAGFGLSKAMSRSKVGNWFN